MLVLQRCYCMQDRTRGAQFLTPAVSLQDQCEEDWEEVHVDKEEAMEVRFDERTGEALDPFLVRQARLE